MVGDARTAIVSAGEYGMADTAQEVSEALGTSAVYFSVSDSDCLAAHLYTNGEHRHRYLSEIAATGSPFEDDDGVFKDEIDGRLYAHDDPEYPRGPRGEEPGWLAPFGVGTVDLERLEALLKGVPDEGVPTSSVRGTPRWLFAEQQHRAVLTTLNLDPAPLTDQLGPADS